MSTLLLLTPSTQSSTGVLPALGLLQHTVKVIPPDAARLVHAPPHDVILIDGRRELTQVRALTRMLHTVGTEAPVLLIVNEGGLSAVAADWGMDDVLLDTAGPGEVEARLRLSAGRGTPEQGDDEHVLRAGGLCVNDTTYTAEIDGVTMDLTFKEFELLRYLVQHPGRVFSRPQLLQEVWGYDYFGGSRTVDVHVRRLRAKLGPENESLIRTIRNVGYCFNAPTPSRESARGSRSAGQTPSPPTKASG